MALTATATERVIDDITKHLGLRQPRLFNLGIYRPNLHYEVRHTAKETAKQQHLVQLLRETEGSGIVYCATVKHCEDVARVLEGEGIPSAHYHGRLNAARRHDTQDRFMDGALKAIVATNAFGMGIDKAEIRFIIHYDMPGSLESYYQETGRAGRDGEPAACVLLYKIEDRRTHQFFMGGKYPAAEDILAVRGALESLGADRTGVTATAVREQATDVARTKLRSVLAVMKELGMVREGRGGRLTLVHGSRAPARLDDIAREYAAKREADRDKLERMASYAQSATCRWKLLLDYFREDDGLDRCGTCDNCRHPPEERYASR